MSRCTVQRVVSGGQTGVDRGALQAAIELGIPHGGWCPAGRRAEDGVIPDEFQLTECESADYAVRTERNVLDADGTLIVSPAEPTGGTLYTRQMAVRHKRPWLLLDPTASDALDRASTWLLERDIRVLNVAGPRESVWPGAAGATEAFITALLSRT